MKDLTREQIDKALDELREMRKEPTYKGFLERHYAMCYSMSSRISVYDWNKLPEEYICPICGKKFGEKNAKPIECYWFYGNGKVKLPPILISEWEYVRMLRLYEKVRQLGFDAFLRLHCDECIMQKKAHPMEFGFRISPEQEYTVSYPRFESESSVFLRLQDDIKDINVNNLILPLLNDNAFEVYEYVTAVSFLEEVWKQAGGGSVVSACRDWLARIKNETTYEGKPWSAVFRAVYGILGLDLG